MRTKSILLASAAVAIFVVSAASADARSRHRTKQDIKEDEITRQLNLDQLNAARSGTTQSTPAPMTNPDQSDMQDQTSPPERQEPANPPSSY